MAKNINIYGRLHSQTGEGIVTTANEIYDETQNKFQSEINEEALNQEIELDSTPTSGSTNPVTSNGVKEALDDKADKLNTYTKTEVNNLIPSIEQDIVVGALPASGVANTIYRVPGTTSYTDWGWDGTQWVELATYNNAIDDVPTPSSDNLVKSGGVFNAIEGGFYYSFDVAAGSSTPTTQRLDVDIAAGDSFYLKVSDSTGDGNSYQLYFLYEGQSSGTRVGNILSGVTREYTAEQKIDKIYLWKGAVSTNKTVRIDVWTGLSGQINLIEGELLSLKGATIKQAILSEAYTITSMTRDAKGNVTAASIVFPDGQTGTMTVTRNSAGAATSAVYTYGTSTYTLTITRDSNNNVTATSLS